MPRQSAPAPPIELICFDDLGHLKPLVAFCKTRGLHGSVNTRINQGGRKVHTVTVQVLDKKTKQKFVEDWAFQSHVRE